ncbi:MAG: ATP-grasp domain-containing protein, partial [Betaproteobacteria bacterium]
MFTHAAQALGFKVLVVDPDPLSPTGAVADRQLLAAYDDHAAIEEMARACAAVTTEFENVPASALEQLARSLPTRPAAAAVRIAQDREREKSFLASHGVAIAPFRAITIDADCDDIAARLLPGILKTARLGYDGKGQKAVRSAAEARAAFEALGRQPCVLEQRVDLAMEISVLIARGAGGQTIVWPVAENEHRDGILDLSIIPARISD